MSSSRFRQGTRVYAAHGGVGTLAERGAVDERAPYELPEGDDALAVALGIAGVTGWLAVRRAHVAAGDRVVVLAATRTVGQVAIHAARHAGAAGVVGAGRNAARLEQAR